MGQMCIRHMYRFIALCFFLSLSLCLRTSAAIDQGKVKVTVEGNNLTRRDVMRRIEKQTGLTFFYSAYLLNEKEKVSISMIDQSLDDVLQKFLLGTDLTWAYDNKIIFIREKTERGSQTATTIKVDSSITTMTLTGKVVSADGNPVPGATIQVKRTKDGAATDVWGNFSMPNVRTNDVIIVSSIGFESREIKVSGNTILAQLNVAVSGLDETVVVGYGTTTQRMNTGNVSSIKARDIQKQPLSNPLTALEGRVPGMFIQQKSGISGGAYKVQIRGQNSMRAEGNDPLYVIDGVPYMPGNVTRLSSIIGFGNPLSYINPSDIESIDVLKDGDATAIYGSRGANGVVLITTKKAKTGKTAVDLSYNTGWSFQPRPKLLSTSEYLTMRREAYRNDNVVPSNVLGDKGYAPDLLIWDTTRNIDWSKQLLGKSGKYNDVQLSVSGGTDATQFLIGGGFKRETPVFQGDFSDTKINTHFNINNTSQDKRFKIQFSGSFLNDINNLPNYDIASFTNIAPDAPKPFNPDGSLNWENNTFINPYGNFLISYNSKVSNLLSNVVVSYEIFKGLEAKITGGYSSQQSHEKQAQPITSLSPSYNVTTGSASFANRDIRGWVVEPQLNYRRKIFDGSLSVLLGSTFQNTTSDGQLMYGEGYTNDALLGTIDAASSVFIASNYKYSYKYSSAFGRINYELRRRYVVNLTARRDGSSRFGPGRRFANFGSAGVAWVFSEEDFVKNNFDVLSFGKIRASYATTGNDQINDYSYLSLYTPNSNTYQGVTGLNATGLTNPDYAWEVNKKFEVGTEIGAINNRVFVTASFFRNLSSNQLLNSPLPSITGFSGILANLPALVENKGWEFTVSSTNINYRSFVWKTNANFSVYGNKLLEYPGLSNNPRDKNRFVIGQPLNVFFAYRSVGVDPETGVYKFLDSKGLPTFTPSSSTDKTVYINRDPKFYGGIENLLILKNFELSFLIQYTKQVVFNDWLSNNLMAGQFNTNVPAAIMENRWINPGDIAKYQKLTQTPSSPAAKALSYARQSDLAQINGSYWRLKNISLYYTLPSELIQKLRLRNFRLFLQIQNLYTITSYAGRDPETQNNSIIAPSKSINSGISIGF